MHSRQTSCWVSRDNNAVWYPEPFSRVAKRPSETLHTQAPRLPHVSFISDVYIYKRTRDAHVVAIENNSLLIYCLASTLGAFRHDNPAQELIARYLILSDLFGRYLCAQFSCFVIALCQSKMSVTAESNTFSHISLLLRTVRSIKTGWPSRSTLWMQSPPIKLIIRMTLSESPGFTSTLPSSKLSNPRIANRSGSWFWRVAHGRTSTLLSRRHAKVSSSCFFAAFCVATEGLDQSRVSRR